VNYGAAAWELAHEVIIKRLLIFVMAFISVDHIYGSYFLVAFFGGDPQGRCGNRRGRSVHFSMPAG
jgi:hypothetical protein